MSNEIIEAFLGDSREFLDTTYERRPLIRSVRHLEAVARIISLEMVDELITGRWLTRPTARVVSKGRGLPVEAYTDVLDDGTRLVNPALVLEHLKKGASFVLNQVERHVRAVHDVCAVLEDYFTAPVNATLFVTAPDSAGLRAHFDGQHLFVLQVGGLKEWCLWEPPHPDPADSRVVPEDSLGEPLLQFALEPGDLLYLPRGYVHRAHTTSMFSAHITFLVERVTWQDAIVAECRRLLDRPEFRASLPPGYAVDPPDSDRLDLLQSAARQALLTLDVAAALERSADNEYWKRPMSPRGAFLNWIGAVHDDAPYPC